MPTSALRNRHGDIERAGGKLGMCDKSRLLCSLGLAEWASLQIRKLPSDHGGMFL